MVGLVAQAVGAPSECAAASNEAPPTFPRPVTTDITLRATDATQRHNVVVVFLESTGAQASLGPGADPDLTLYLRALSHRGLRVDELFAPVDHTNKVLGPLFTGSYQYPRNSYLEARALPSPGLPSLLRPLGYRSAFFTPATLSFERKDRILRRLGFDVSRGAESFDTEGFSPRAYFGYEDRVILEPVMDWVDAQESRDGPFLLSILTLTAHHPYNVPGEPLRDRGINGRKAVYDEAVRYTDEFLRELVGEFESRGLLDSTVFLVLGDHGEAFGEHGLWQHSHVVYDEVLHVPGVILAPGLEPGVVTGPRSTLDVLPTLAELLGLELRGTLPGRSLLTPADTTRTLYHAAWNGAEASALRRGRLKYIRQAGRPMEVYDTRRDPFERHSLAPQTHPDTLAAVSAELDAWRSAVEASWHAVACD